MKNSKQMERHFKGLSNHHRLDILLLIEKDVGINVDEISNTLDANFKTISQHTRYLVHAGLIQKNYRGRVVTHTLTPYGKMFTHFIKEFQKIK